MKRMILRLMAVWSFVALISTLVFNVFADTLFDNSDKTIYKASDAWNGLTNEDAVWRWLYRNNQTKNTATPYVEYTLTGSGNSEDLNAPSKNEDGTYDYSTTEKGTVTVFADSTANPGMRNALGRYWMRLSVASGSEPKQSTDNRIVKQFTAPESGSVTISAEDMSGAPKIYGKILDTEKPAGAVLIISKYTADGSEEELWKYEFAYNKATTVNGVETLDFEDLDIDLNKGDRLWFTVSGEKGGTAWAKQVFWNPVVKYNAIYPNIVECEPENNAEEIAVNFEHRIRFDREIRLISADDVIIDGGAKAEDIWLEDGDKTLCIKYSGLEPNKSYNITLNNVYIQEATSELFRPYSFSLKTGDLVQIGTIHLDKEFSAGNNTIFVEINNAAGKEKLYKATLAAVVCKRTATGYSIENTKIMCRNDIGENDKISLTVSIPDAENYFIKAVLLENVPSARSLTPITVFSK